MDTHKTPVIFRKFKDGDIIALFPTLPSEYYGFNITSYMHIGQHSSANYAVVVADTSPAKREEYQDLFNELTAIGYNLEVYKRYNSYLQKQFKENACANRGV